MMGPKQEAQATLFYEVSIEGHVPQDHLLRSIDLFVDLSSIRAHLAEFYSHTGHPSVDPEQLLPSFHEVFRPLVIDALRDALSTAKLSNTVLTTQTIQHDPDLLIR